MNDAPIPNRAVATTTAKSWANLSIAWSDTGNWIVGGYSFCDQESVEEFVAILGTLRSHLIKPPPSGEDHPNEA